MPNVKIYIYVENCEVILNNSFQLINKSESFGNREVS